MGIRLPGREQQRTASGDDTSKLGDYAWWGGFVGDGNAKTERYAHGVGQKKPNSWGLYDMHGNVYEWCEDIFYDAKAYSRRSGVTVDPRVTSGSEYRVLRGGFWDTYPGYARSAFRGRGTPDLRLYGIGFRVVRE